MKLLADQARQGAALSEETEKFLIIPIMIIMMIIMIIIMIIMIIIMIIMIILIIMLVIIIIIIIIILIILIIIIIMFVIIMIIEARRQGAALSKDTEKFIIVIMKMKTIITKLIMMITEKKLSHC